MSDLSTEIETFLARIGSGDDMELNKASEYVVAGKCAHHHEATFHLFETVFGAWKDTPMRRTFFHFNGQELSGEMAQDFLTIFPKLFEDSKLLLARSYAMGSVVNRSPQHGMSMAEDENDDEKADHDWYQKATAENEFTAEVNQRVAELLADDDAVNQIIHFFKRNGAISVGQVSGATAFAVSDDGRDKVTTEEHGMIWGAIQHCLWLTGVTLYLAGAEQGKHQAFLNQVGEQ